MVWDLSWKPVVKAAQLVRNVLKTVAQVGEDHPRAWRACGRANQAARPVRVPRFADAERSIVKTDPAYTTTFAKRGRERKILGAL